MPGQTLAAPSGSGSRLVAWLFRAQLTKRLLVEVEDNESGVSAVERPQLIREAERRIFGLEVVEEKLVVAALEAGLEVHRRPDASAWAILGLRGCGGGSAGRGGGVNFPWHSACCARGGPLRRCPQQQCRTRGRRSENFRPCDRKFVIELLPAIVQLFLNKYASRALPPDEQPMHLR